MHTLSIAASLIMIAGTLLLFWMAWLLWQMRAKGAPFWPSSAKKMKAMLELARIKPTDCVADLGSGDGRLVIAAAESGAAKAIGYELDPFWFNVSEEKKRRSPHAEKIHFIKQSFWEVNWGEFDVVFLYQGKHVLRQLSEKLQKELKPGSRVISNSFKLPGWKLEASHQGSYLYVVCYTTVH